MLGTVPYLTLVIRGTELLRVSIPVTNEPVLRAPKRPDATPPAADFCDIDPSDRRPFGVYMPRK